MSKTVLEAVVCAVLVVAVGWMAVSKTGVFAHAPATGPVEVKIDNYSFSPSDIIVKAGTTVTWVNHDDVPHTVKSDEGAFKSKAMDTDDKLSFTFDKPGVYEYYCSVHPRMMGKVVVR